MNKNIENKKIKYLVMNVMMVTLVLLVTAVIFLNFKNTKKTIAASVGEIEIRVEKLTTVSMYAFGEGVELVESTSNYDLYTADIGTNVKLQAVNETRLFTDWIITAITPVGNKILPSIADLTDNIINFDVTNDMNNLNVSVNRRNATADDYGKYMMDRYVIVDTADLIALQNILSGSNNDADFAKYYENSSSYDTAEKKNTIRTDLQYGYYLISNNFTVFDNQFKGIGTKERPFQGIVCGKNETNSSLFITINDTEQIGEKSYGLFSYLGNEAIIRNLKVNTSIGITPSSESTNTATTIYAGGLAGVIDGATLLDVEVSANIGIDSKIANNIYVGGIAGSLEANAGIDSISDVVYNGENAKWTVVSHKNGSTVCAGFVSGIAEDSYIKEVDLIVTNQSVELKNDSVANAYTNSKLCLGNLFGYYLANTSIETIDDIMIMGEQGESLIADTTNGDASVGGLIGYVDANQTGKLNIGNVSFRVINSQNEYKAKSMATSNVTNLYAGGLIGYINGNQVIGNDEFKINLHEVLLEDKSASLIATYLFEGDYKVSTIQNGTSLSTSNGKSICGGLVGKGSIDLNGTNEKRSSFAIASPTSSLIIEAMQTKLSATSNQINDKEHLAAALVFGSVENKNISVSNIDIYTNNTTIKAQRESGSKAIGDLHVGGFIGYATGSSFTNITLYFNDSKVLAESLSYEGKNTTEDTNSAFCGGFIGETLGNTSLTNIEFTGYDTFDFSNIGTTSTLESIQNTAPGGNNYMGENYLGGIVGRAQYTTITNCKFNGSETNKDYIRMSGHESPDSAFCGGIVGLIRTATNTVPSSLTNCEVINTEVIGNATCVITYDNPDIYIGGIAGAAYIHNTDVTIAISNCKLIKSNVYALGNELIASFAGGILGGSTWESSIVINNCYVFESTVKANISTTIQTTKNLESSSGGILGGMKGNPNNQNVTISNCAVMDSEVSSQVHATFTSIKAYSAGILGFWENDSNNNKNKVKINNCYSNAYVNATHQNNSGTANVYGIAYNCSFGNNQYSYYLLKNLKSSSNNLGVALGTGPFEITSTPSNPYKNYTGLQGSNGYGQKLFIELLENDTPFTVSNNKGSIVSISSTADGIVLAHIWININSNGGLDNSSNLIIPDHHDKLTSAQNGWFILDYVTLYTGDIQSITSDLTDIDTSYTDGTNIYEHKYEDLNDDSVKENYLENIKNSSDKIQNNYIEESVTNNVKEFTFKVYEDMLTLNVDFNITHYSSNYTLLFKNENNEVIESAQFKHLYGDISLQLVEKHVDSIYDKYQLVYSPNENIEDDATFDVYFVIGNGEITAQTSLRINLVANKLQLIGITYADYTLPLNYYEDESDLGTQAVPYQLYVGSIIKFLPVFTKSNDIEIGRNYISEDFIEKCQYSISNTTDFSIFTNGELKVGNTKNRTSTLTIRHNSSSVTVNLASAKDISASYSIVGAEIQGITHATNTTDFYFEQTIRNNYSGVPRRFEIVIGNTVYDLTDNPKAYPEISVYKKTITRNANLELIDNYDINASNYVVRVDSSLLNNGNISNIQVNVEYPIVYTITFSLQCEVFNNSIDESELTKTYKVESGTNFSTFFATSNGSKTLKEEVLEWANNAEIFGFVFTGFYLVNNATSVNAYGVSFEDLTESNYVINSSNTFYGRWSYLIEIVEASGTYIKTGFNSSFMQDYIKPGFNRAIQIPINANQGYVFKVETEDHYQGKAGINAYIVRLDNLGNKEMVEVPIEYYQNNKNLYYIRPEYITGYLVIMTNVSNSEVIVGENTSSLTENITTEDGVITFKYIANHYNDGINQSYIYNLENGVDYKTLKKEFALDFYKQSNHSDLKLPDQTEIRVYYNAYINGSTTPSNTIVGTYITHGDDRIYLTEFKLLDLETNAFSNTKTFGETLGSYESVTEVFYFTITPPNGYTEKVKNEMANYVVECGYCYGKTNTGQSISYLRGVRTQKELANPNDLNDIISLNNIYESAKQEKIYRITPSRDTRLDAENDGSYTFTDDKTYSIYDLILTDTQKLPEFNYISLFNDSKHSTLESTNMSFNIKELRLKVGYRLGTLTIYGKTSDNNAEWEKVTDIEITSAIYNDYIVDFKDALGDYPYSAYKIENFSANEIRISEIDVVSQNNGVVYDGIISNIVEKGIVDEKHYYSVKQDIIGDSRHDGKIFMLAIQVKDKMNGNVIIHDILGDIYINVNDIGLDINHYVNLNDKSGKNVAYINLSSIISVLNVSQINFNITLPEDYQIHEVQLLEVTNEYKPASGEVRLEYSTEHKHYYVDGLCKCGDKLNDYASLVDEFAQMLVNDFNTAAGNSTTTIEEFYSTSADNIKKAWTNTTLLAKYQWFFEFIKEEITTIASAHNVLTDAEYLETIELLNNMIVGSKPTTIFTRDDYSTATEIIRYYIHGLINRLEVADINAPSAYSNYLVDYFDTTNRARFLSEYEHSKNTIKIAVYNTSGLVSGGFTENNATTDTIAINYFTDNTILPSNGGANNLRWQNKILMNKIADNVYKIVAIANTCTSNSEYNITVDIMWTHAITTAYNVDFEALYGSHVGSYIVINDSDVAVRNTSYVSTYNALKNLTWDGYFEATIIDNVDHLVDKIVVDPNGNGDYTTIQDAINAAEDGDIISVAAGSYTTANINKSITLEGANAGVNPVTQARGTETTFTGDITVSADDVIIDGIELNGKGRIKGAASGADNVIIRNIVSTNSTVNSGGVANDAPIYFHTTTANAEYNNIIIDQVRYYEGTSARRAMIFYGCHINGLTITNSYFEANSKGSYNDGIKIDDPNNTYGIKGNVIIKNNHFENYEQYVIWFGEYAEGTYDLINNVYVDCYLKTLLDSNGVYSSCTRFQTYTGATSGKVYVNCKYNTTTSSGTLIRFDVNSSRTSTTQIVKVNYNKMSDNKHSDSLYINNKNSYKIDATYNYFSTTPNSSNCLNADTSNNYANAASVPPYTGD